MRKNIIHWKNGNKENRIKTPVTRRKIYINVSVREHQALDRKKNKYETVSNENDIIRKQLFMQKLL